MRLHVRRRLSRAPISKRTARAGLDHSDEGNRSLERGQYSLRGERRLSRSRTTLRVRPEPSRVGASRRARLVSRSGLVLQDRRRRRQLAGALLGSDQLFSVAHPRRCDPTVPLPQRRGGGVQVNEGGNRFGPTSLPTLQSHPAREIGARAESGSSELKRPYAC
jgi:hypothetical protein